MNDTALETEVYRSKPMPEKQFRKRPTKFTTIMFIMGVVTLTLAVLQGEVARWNAAAAQNAILEERYEDAIKSIDRGLMLNPQYDDLLYLRANANLRLKRYDDCLKDLQRAADLAAKDEDITADDMAPRVARSGVLQQQGNFPAAVAELTHVVEFWEEQFRLRDDTESKREYAMSLNNRAYVQALGKLDLPQALKDIQRGLEIRGFDDAIMLDTLGYLQLLNGENETALATLEKAVLLTQTENAIKRTQYRREAFRLPDPKMLDAALRSLDQNYAVILHHRGEAFTAAGEKEKAAEDIAEALKLGYDPENGIW